MRKKLLALALVFALVFTLCACGAAAPKEPQKSQEMTDYETAVDALPTEITYDSWEAIHAALDAYDALTDEEKTAVDTIRRHLIRQRSCTWRCRSLRIALP